MMNLKAMEKRVAVAEMVAANVNGRIIEGTFVFNWDILDMRRNPLSILKGYADQLEEALSKHHRVEVRTGLGRNSVILGDSSWGEKPWAYKYAWVEFPTALKYATR